MKAGLRLCTEQCSLFLHLTAAMRCISLAKRFLREFSSYINPGLEHYLAQAGLDYFSALIFKIILILLPISPKFLHCELLDGIMGCHMLYRPIVARCNLKLKMEGHIIIFRIISLSLLQGCKVEGEFTYAPRSANSSKKPSALHTSPTNSFCSSFGILRQGVKS